MHKPFREIALPLLAAGYSPVAILPNTKRPALAGWQRLCDAPLSLDEIERFARSPIAYGVGVALGFNGLIAVDIDTDDVAIIGAIRSVLTMSTVAKRGRRGWTIFGRDPGGRPRSRHFASMVDILAHGSQTVLPPTPHPGSGQPYHWIGAATLLSTPVAVLPVIGPDIAHRLAAALSPWLIKAPRPAPARRPMRPFDLTQHERHRQLHYVETILSKELPVLAAMGPDSGRNLAAYRLVCRVGRWVHHGVVPIDRLTTDVLDACEANRLVSDDGRKAVLATVASALAKSAGDALPDLGARHG
jgi:hypothetical protein